MIFQSIFIWENFNKIMWHNSEAGEEVKLNTKEPAEFEAVQSVLGHPSQGQGCRKQPQGRHVLWRTWPCDSLSLSGSIRIKQECWHNWKGRDINPSELSPSLQLRSPAETEDSGVSRHHSEHSFFPFSRPLVRILPYKEKNKRSPWANVLDSVDFFC